MKGDFRTQFQRGPARAGHGGDDRQGGRRQEGRRPTPRPRSSARPPRSPPPRRPRKRPPRRWPRRRPPSKRRPTPRPPPTRNWPPRPKPPRPPPRKRPQAKAAAEKDADNAELAKANAEAKKAADEADKKVKELEKKVAGRRRRADQSHAGSHHGRSGQHGRRAGRHRRGRGHQEGRHRRAAGRTGAQGLASRAGQDRRPTPKPPSRPPPPPRSRFARWPIRPTARNWQAPATTTSCAPGPPTPARPIETFAGHKAAVAGRGLPGRWLAHVRRPATAPTVVWNPTPAWTLERTIGNVDDPTTLVDRVIALDFSPDGKLLATGGGEPSRSGELKIWNVADGTLARAIPDAHSDTIFGLEFSPDGQFLASLGGRSLRQGVPRGDGAHYKSFEGHTHHVLGVAWKWDGKVLASCGADNVIKMWDFITGDQIRTTAALRQGSHVDPLRRRHCRGCSSARGDKTVRSLNSDNGAVERTFRRQQRLHVLHRRQRRWPDRHRRRPGQRAVRVADRQRPAAQVVPRSQAARKAQPARRPAAEPW